MGGLGSTATTRWGECADKRLGPGASRWDRDTHLQAQEQEQGKDGDREQRGSTERATRRPEGDRGQRGQQRKPGKPLNHDAEGERGGPAQPGSQGEDRGAAGALWGATRFSGSPDEGCLAEGQPTPGNPEMEVRDPKNQENGDPEEDTAAALQRLVELTAPRVTLVRSLHVQYRLIRELGSGSYGRVLLARPRHGGPAVALKLLRRDSVLRTTFLREFCVGRCVSSHPGLLRTLVGPLQTPRHFAFAQEYAPYGDLSGMLQERGLPELLVKRVAAQLAGALDFLHSRGLVHADVKPDNVLVFDPVCSRVALGDLGLTRPEGSPTPAPPVPLPCAPPELCLLPPPATLPLRAALDSWGLGVLLFCASTARFPWDVALAPDPGFEAFAGWMAARPQPPQPPAPWHQFAPPALALLQGLLDLDPDTRSPPLTVLDFLGDDWGLERNREGPWGLRSMSSEDGEEAEGGASLEEWTEEEEEGVGGGGRMGTEGGAS